MDISTSLPVTTTTNLSLRNVSPNCTVNATAIGTTNTSTTVTRLPNPFSIESIISSRNTSPPRPPSLPRTIDPHLNQLNLPPALNHHHHHHHEHNNAASAKPPSATLPDQPNTASAPLSAAAQFALPNGGSFPLYNPWMGYLAAASHQQLQQQQHHQHNHNQHHDAGERLSAAIGGHFDQMPPADMFFGMPALAAAAAMDPRLSLVDPMQREKLAQLFANNVRDPKLTEFLLMGAASAAGGGTTSVGDSIVGGLEAMMPMGGGVGDVSTMGSDNIGTIPMHLSQMYLQERGRLLLQQQQQQQQLHPQTQQHQQQQQHRAQQRLHRNSDGGGGGGTRDGDADSAESSSELSMTMSPDGYRKSAGTG